MCWLCTFRSQQFADERAAEATGSMDTETTGADAATILPVDRRLDMVVGGHDSRGQTLTLTRDASRSPLEDATVSTSTPPPTARERALPG